MCDNNTNVNYDNIDIRYENCTIVVKLSKSVMVPVNGALNVKKQLTMTFDLEQNQTISKLDFKYCNITNPNTIDSCVHYTKERISRSTIELAKPEQLDNKGEFRQNLSIKKYFATILENDLIEENNFVYNTTYIGASRSKEPEIKFVEDGRLCDLKSGQKQKAQEIVKTTLQNIAKQYNKEYNFGLDSELIYLNILVNTNAELHSKLLLDQLKFFEDKKSTFNEYFIKPEFQDLKGHVFLKIFDLKVIKMGKLGVSQIGKSNELFVDSQTSFVGSIEKQLNQGYNFQTQIGGGCCGYFASCYAIEILNNIEKYQPLLEIQNVNRITKKQQCLLSQLHLNTMQKVSELIDGQSVIKTQKDQESDFKIKLDDGITYYIDSGCGRSNCINIEGLFCYLIQKQGYNFGNNRCIEKQINTQNQKALCGKNHNIGISKRVCGMQKLFVERLEYTRSKSAPARFGRW